MQIILFKQKIDQYQSKNDQLVDEMVRLNTNVKKET